MYIITAQAYMSFIMQRQMETISGEERYLQCLDTAIQTSLKYGGNVSHHHGVGTAKAKYMEAEHGKAGVYVMKALKDAIDPKGIVNKGVLGL